MAGNANIFVKTFKLNNKNKHKNTDHSMSKGDVIINIHRTKYFNACPETSKKSLHYDIQMSETGWNLR